MKNFEKTLIGLFDFQRFVGNPRLDRLIRETEARYAAVELSEDDLAIVSAAGEPAFTARKNLTDRADEDD